MAIEDSRFWRQLEEANDEDGVRGNIAAGNYGESKLGIAEEWLRRRDVSRNEASNREQMSIARSAKNAAWTAAMAAIIAAICAIIALAFSS